MYIFLLYSSYCKYSVSHIRPLVVRANILCESPWNLKEQDVTFPLEPSFCEKLRSQGLGLFSVVTGGVIFSFSILLVSTEDGWGETGERTFLIMLCVFACKYMHMTQQICPLLEVVWLRYLPFEIC